MRVRRKIERERKKEGKSSSPLKVRTFPPPVSGRIELGSSDSDLQDGISSSMVVSERRSEKVAEFDVGVRDERRRRRRKESRWTEGKKKQKLSEESSRSGTGYRLTNP